MTCKHDGSVLQLDLKEEYRGWSHGDVPERNGRVGLGTLLGSLKLRCVRRRAQDFFFPA